MDWKKWIEEHQKDVADVVIALAGLTASILIASLLPDHDDAND